MKRREVTDEMVDRAWKVMPDLEDGFGKDHLRHALEAALNPPPQIEVTREMSLAGEKSRNAGDSTDNIYRTMRALEPKAVPPLLFCVKCGSTHIVESGVAAEDYFKTRVHSRATDTVTQRVHRRSTD